MKMHKQDFEELQSMLKNHISQLQENFHEFKSYSALEAHQITKGFSPMRIRWDFFWSIPDNIRSPYYMRVMTHERGLNDEHFDTALRHALINL